MIHSGLSVEEFELIYAVINKIDDTNFLGVGLRPICYRLDSTFFVIRFARESFQISLIVKKVFRAGCR